MYKSLGLLLIFLNTFVFGQQNDAKVSMFRGNPQLTGVHDVKPIYQLNGLKFSFKTEGPIRSTPCIAEGVLYFGSGDGNFYAIDGHSGKELWRFKTGGAVHSSPSIANGVVYFTSRDHYLYALNAKNGRELWKFKMLEDLGDQNYWDYYLSSPNLVNQNLYAGGGDGNLYAFNVKTKKVLWKFNAGSRIRTTPAVTDSSVIFGTMSGHVYSIRKATGSEQWRFATNGASINFDDVGNDLTSIFCSPSVAKGIITVGGRDSFLYAIDLITGKEKWRFNHQGSWVLSTAIDSDNVFAGSGSAFFIQCVDLNSGTEKWRFKTQGAVFSSPAIAGNMIYFGDRAGNLFALDANRGIEKWRFPMGSQTFSSPLISNGTVYCGADDGVMYALNGASNPDTAVKEKKKIVYWEGRKNDKSFSWFQSNADLVIRDFFRKAGYELLDAEQLALFLEQQIPLNTASVVVFADNKIPKSVVSEKTENALIRRYLNGGGKIVFFGPNPLAYVTDSTTGIVTDIDYSIPEKIFGIKFLEPRLMMGVYGSQVTSDGKKWGLRGYWVSSGALEANQVSTVLAVNEFDKATAWVKNYGGREGSGLVQLWLPQTLVGIDLFQVKAAIEYGIGW